ncbi:hypothetical protein BAE44_0021444, partial [Dichanthelium oligosanthes]
LGADMSTVHRPFCYFNCLARFMHPVVFKKITRYVSTGNSKLC